MSEKRRDLSPSAFGRSITRKLGPLALPVPAFAWTLLFFFVPLAILVVYSFGQINLLTYKVEFGWTLDNYRQIANNLYLSSIIRSLELSLVATAICLIIGFPVAYLISLQRRPAAVHPAGRGDRAVLDVLHHPHLRVGWDPLQ